MSRNKDDNSFLGLFKGIHKKVFNLLTFLGLTVLGMSVTIGIIDSQISENNKESWENIKPLISQLKNSIFSTVIMIFFFEIGLRQESLEEIRKLFEETQPSKYISNFYPNHDQFNNEIIQNILEARNTDINLLGIHREMSIFENPGIKTIKEKVQSGCNFKILISHPDSSVINSLEILKDMNRKGTLTESLRVLKSLRDELSQPKILPSLNGSIEIKLHKDVFVPVCYYSAPGLTAVWMYLSDQGGVEFPGFVVSDQELIDNMKNYFDHLWDKSDTLLLVRKDYEVFNSNLIPSSYSPQSIAISPQSAIAKNSSNP